MLTGDLNVVVVEWIAQYRVADPYKYLFRVRNVTKTFRDMNEAVMRAVVGDRSVDEVITIGRLEIENQAKLMLQKLCNQYETGIQVEQIVLRSVDPPDPVKPSFNEVNQAEQERERAINEARGEYNRVIPKARGEADQLIEQAVGYAIDRVNRAKGDASLFDDVYAAYRRAPRGDAAANLPRDDGDDISGHAAQDTARQRPAGGAAPPPARRGGGEEMKQVSIFAVLVIVLLIVAALGGAFYTVEEWQQVIITQFGRPVGDPVTSPGLKIKTPFVQTANFFEKRFLEWDGDPEPGHHQGQALYLGRHLRPLADLRPPPVLPTPDQRAWRPVPPRRHLER